MSVTADSRFNFTDVIMVVDGKGEAQENLRVDIPYPRPVVTTENLPELVTYTVRGDDSWRGLSYRIYKRPDLWWAIAEFSGVIDPFTELQAGVTTPKAKGTLKVPSVETVMFDLLMFKR